MLIFISKAVPLFSTRLPQNTLCAEKQCPCYNFFNVVSVHIFTDFVLLIHNMQTIPHFWRKEDEFHCNVHDPQKHIKPCLCGLIRLLRFSENSSRYSLFFPTMLKTLVTYNLSLKDSLRGP